MFEYMLIKMEIITFLSLLSPSTSFNGYVYILLVLYPFFPELTPIATFLSAFLGSLK